MNRDNPALRWLVWPITLLVMGPLIYAGFTHPYYGILPALVSGHTHRIWWCLVLVLYVLPLIAVLRWRRLVVAASLVAMLTFSQIVLAGFNPQRAQHVEVTFGDAGHESGIEVWCNEVHLGTTPFRMRDDEFYKRVPVSKHPPEQPVVSYQANQQGLPDQKDFQWWSWTWTPGNPFAYSGSNQMSSIFFDDAKLKTYLQTAPYWWRFEKDGCITLRSMNVFSGGGGGGADLIRLQVLFGVQLPAQAKMLQLVLESLRAMDYRPTPDWIDFVLKYRDELLYTLIEESGKDARLAQVLDQMADAYFELPDNPDYDACRQALDRTFASVRDSREKDFDDFARRTALKIAKKYPQLLVELARREIESTPSDWSMRYSRLYTGPRNLLLDLLSQVPTPQLFDLLVYLQGLSQMEPPQGNDPRLLIALANTKRAEAIPIISAHLEKVWRATGNQRFVHDQARENSVKMMTRVDIPELEDQFWYLISEKIKPDFFNKFGPLPTFIQSRIDRGGDLEQLAGRIASCDALSNEQKGPLLAQLNTPSAGVRMRTLADQLGDDQRNVLVREVSRLPANPAMVGFLVESARRQYKLQPNYYQPECNLAILRIDAPEVRELVRDRLKAERKPNEVDPWHHLTSLPDPAVRGRLSSLAWAVPELRQTPRDRRTDSVRLLQEIGTDDAFALLKEWADDPQSGVQSEAKRALQEPGPTAAGSEAKNQALLKQAHDLFSGRVPPDDLLPKLPAAHWNGQTYEPIPVKKEM